MGKKILSIIGGIIYIILRFLVFLYPGFSTAGLVYAVGALMLIGGIAMIYEAKFHVPYVKSSFTFNGIMLVILGLFFLFGNPIVNSTALSIMLIFSFLLTAVVQLQYVAFIRNALAKVIIVILNILIIIMSIYLLFRPLSANAVLVWQMAFMFIFLGANKIVSVFFEDK